jgi:predicted membrane protein
MIFENTTRHPDWFITIFAILGIIYIIVTIFIFAKMIKWVKNREKQKAVEDKKDEEFEKLEVVIEYRKLQNTINLIGDILKLKYRN